MRHPGSPDPAPHRRLSLATAGVLIFAAACGGTSPRANVASSVVRVTVTPTGCAPRPADVRAGTVEFLVTNLDAPTVSEVEVRTPDLSQVLGERESLVVGLSAAFSAVLSPGRYVVNCPGADVAHWPLLVRSPG